MSIKEGVLGKSTWVWAPILRRYPSILLLIMIMMMLRDDFQQELSSDSNRHQRRVYLINWFQHDSKNSIFGHCKSILSNDEIKCVVRCHFAMSPWNTKITKHGSNKAQYHHRHPSATSGGCKVREREQPMSAAAARVQSLQRAGELSRLLLCKSSNPSYLSPLLSLFFPLTPPSDPLPYPIPLLTALPQPPRRNSSFD